MNNETLLMGRKGECARVMLSFNELLKGRVKLKQETHICKSKRKCEKYVGGASSGATDERVVVVVVTRENLL